MFCISEMAFVKESFLLVAFLKHIKMHVPQFLSTMSLISTALLSVPYSRENYCHYNLPVSLSLWKQNNISKTQVVSYYQFSLESKIPLLPRIIEQGIQALPHFKLDCPPPTHKTLKVLNSSRCSSLIIFTKKHSRFNSDEIFLWIAIAIFSLLCIEFLAYKI